MQNSAIIGGQNFGKHDFGYICYMPKKITIENLKIEDANPNKSYKGFYLFDNFNSKMKNHNYKEEYPYIRTETVVLKNITTTSSKALQISKNPLFFKNIKIKE